MERVETLVMYGGVFLLLVSLTMILWATGAIQWIRERLDWEQEEKTREICENCEHSEDRIKDRECVFIYCREDKRFCSRYGWCGDFKDKQRQSD